MMPVTSLPAVNATLNFTSAVLLVLGYRFIRQKRIGPHVACMITAVATSTLFLVSYLYYHAHAGGTRFPGTGLSRTAYLAILISHTALAILIVPFILRTLYLAAKKRYKEHEHVARVTLPLWLYVSVTGVIVYWMLYQVRWE